MTTETQNASEAEKKAAAEAAAAKKDEPKAEPKAKGKAKVRALVAVHRVVYGDNRAAAPGDFIDADDLKAADLEQLLELGAVREPTEAEAAVAGAALESAAQAAAAETALG